VRIALICPAPPGSRLGNRITALRWQRILRELGHTAFIVTELGIRGYDLLVALHARRSAEAVLLSRERHPSRPIVVALTGTDLYRDIRSDASAKRSLELASLLVVLHEGGVREIEARLRPRVRVIPQSAPLPTKPSRRSARAFEVAVVGHLRPEKDPLRTALAARLLPEESRIIVLHAGRALDEPMQRAALAEQRDNPRYRWLGEVSPGRARALIARCRLLSLTSEIEGGANVLSEALAAGTPVVASRIPCTEALLGEDYPGLFPFGRADKLARLLSQVERDPRFLAELARRCRARRALVSPSREKAAWRALLREIMLARPPILRPPPSARPAWPSRRRRLPAR
jgi:putative glycosyltransferase (TIGR04348 family)